MSKRHQHAPAADYGAQPWRVTVEDVADPEAPARTIRRARPYDPIRRLDLPPALVNAADRFRVAYEVSQGARDGVGNVRLEPWQRCHYAARVVAARDEVRDSLQAVGLRLSAVFVAAVIECQPVRCMERAKGMRSGSGPDLIREALERLLTWQTESGR